MLNQFVMVYSFITTAIIMATTIYFSPVNKGLSQLNFY